MRHLSGCWRLHRSRIVASHMKTEYILIDGNAIGYAQQLGMARLSVGDQPTHAIYGFLTALRNLVMPTPQRRVPIVLWDGNAAWRRELLEDYKANRNDDPKKLKIKAEYKAQTNFIEGMIWNLGIDQIRSHSCEADDLAGAYARLLVKAGHTVELVTGDQDWLQLVNPNVTWNDPIRNRKVDIMNFEDFTGFSSTEKFIDAKCLQGDASDNIKGVGGIGKVGAKKLLDQFISVEEFLHGPDTSGLKKLPAAWSRLLADPSLYYRNLKLMRLDGTHPSVKDRVITKGKWNRGAFERVCEDLAFFSITKNMDSWIVPFERFKA